MISFFLMSLVASIPYRRLEPMVIEERVTHDPGLKGIKYDARHLF